MNLLKSYDFYLSYHWKSLADVIKLHKLLITNGYKVFLDLVEMKLGDHMDERVQIAIQNSNILLCLITQDYLRTSNCTRELKYARKQSKLIYSIMLEKLSLSNEMLSNEIHLDYDSNQSGQILEFIQRNYTPKSFKQCKIEKLYNFLPTVQAYRA